MTRVLLFIVRSIIFAYPASTQAHSVETCRCAAGMTAALEAKIRDRDAVFTALRHDIADLQDQVELLLKIMRTERRTIEELSWRAGLWLAAVFVIGAVLGFLALKRTKNSSRRARERAPGAVGKHSHKGYFGEPSSLYKYHPNATIVKN